MNFNSFGKLLFFLVCIFFVSGLSLTLKQIISQQSKPSTIIGIFNLVFLLIIIVVFLLFDIYKLHMIWLFFLLLIVSRTKYAFQIGAVLFNVVCFLLRKPNVVIDKDNLLK